MKVLRYNIAEGGAGRLREIAALIGRQRPDAVALVEANSRANAETLAGMLGMARAFGEANCDYHLAWLSRTPILALTNYRHPGLAKTLLEIVVADDGGPLHLFAAHLASRHQPMEPAAEIPLILDLLASAGGRPHLLVGDFNALRAGESIGTPPPGVVPRGEAVAGATGGDLIGALLTAEWDGQRLTEGELLGFCVLLLIAGNETTTNLLGNTVQILSDAPKVQAALVADPSLWPGAIEESLRFHSPVQSMFRATIQETTLGEQTIPAGSYIRAWLGSANRDEAVFPDAATYDLRRTPNRHIAFGVGIQFCLGAPLARLEAQVGLAALYRRFPQLRVATDQPLTYLASDVVHGPTALPVRL